MECQKAEFITKVLKTIMVISFRYTVVSNLGTGNLEKIYSDCALAIREGKVKSPAEKKFSKEVFSHLRPAYVEDERFVTDFAASITRYILAQINDSLESNHERNVSDGGDKITLEHIMPKKPGTDWQSLIPADEEYEDYVDRIGNLTLLEKGKNKGIANAGFKEKKEKAYSTSTLALNRDLANKSTWTIEEIKTRSKHLAKRAIQIWRSDYQ